MKFDNESQPVPPSRITVIEADGSRTTYEGRVPDDVRRRINAALRDGSIRVSLVQRQP